MEDVVRYQAFIVADRRNRLHRSILSSHLARPSVIHMHYPVIGMRITKYLVPVPVRDGCALNRMYLARYCTLRVQVSADDL